MVRSLIGVQICVFAVAGSAAAQRTPFIVAGTIIDESGACESLGADGMVLTFSFPDGSPAFESFAYCELTPLLGLFPDGSYTLQLHAVNGVTTVASSLKSDEFQILEPDLTDLGTLTLTP